MIGRCLTAGTLFLALVSTAAAIGQDKADAGGAETPLASLVLVLNVISATHARPATGVVIGHATPEPAPAAGLVLVPADFVSAGDEIVVLDGGTDILRHGRKSRTLARSPVSGVALLEVEGLERPGVEFSSSPWPPPGPAELDFAAWPAAEELAEGAALIRSRLQLDGGQIVSDAPGVSGPLFDPCGRLAAWHLAGDDSRLVAGAAVADYLASAGYPTLRAPCAKLPPGAPAAEAQQAPEPASESAAPPDPASTKSPAADVETAQPGVLRWLWAGGLLTLAVAGVFLAIGTRRRRPVLQLAGVGPENHGDRLELRGGTSLLQRGGRTLAFELKAGRILVSDPGGDDPPRLVLAVAGTPCLPGEVFVLEPGQEISIGAEAWRVQPGPGVTP